MSTSVTLRDGRKVVIDECATGSWEGGNVWPPALELVSHLDAIQLQSGLVASSAILECGSGCGLVGIAAALLGARVVLSDLPVALPTLVANAAANGLVVDDTIEVAVLDWTEVEQTLLASGRLFDLVIASECLYDPEMVLPLLRTAHRACEPNGSLLLAGIIGSECVSLFRRHVQRFFGECVALPNPGTPELEPPPTPRAIHRISKPHAAVLPDL